ncbi:MAG TPA: DUF3604 domain-containing protein [bacterium]|nr:DUF3604 domain-containing protein [bacterium]
MNQSLSLYWGDFHTHFQNLREADSLLEAAAANIDFAAVLCYPFTWERKNGLLVETTGQRPEFLLWWEKLQQYCRRHHQPGKFVTFPGYEWHGNRTRYGDHNVIYFQEGYPLDDTWSLPDLYRRMKCRKAFVIPHHTGYFPDYRGKDWRYFDPELSPVMEVFSLHGSSEGILTPQGQERNLNLGPLTSGGTLQDGLNQGLIVGVIGSNDSPGLPGRWGLGRAGVWAEELTRPSLWEAISRRRTVAVTGDRINLAATCEGQFMGSVFPAGKRVDVEVCVVASDSLDRVELIHNGSVVETLALSGPNFSPAGSKKKKRYKVRLEMGWGPANAWGFSFPPGSFWRWQGQLRVERGRLVGVEKCLTLPGQEVKGLTSQKVSWVFRTRVRTDAGVAGTREGLIFEIEGTEKSTLYFSMEGWRGQYTLKELVGRSYLVPLLRESGQRLREVFPLDKKNLARADVCFFNARKILIHRACPQEEYQLSHTFRQVKLKKGHNYLYLRVSQRNGQLAWSSPLWPQSR